MGKLVDTVLWHNNENICGSCGMEKSEAEDIVNMIAFSKATYRKMIQNLIWATGYNIIAIPLAAGILYPTFILSPARGAVLMSLSTVVVAINAQLVKKQFVRHDIIFRPFGNV